MILLIPYCTLVFGIHGGEAISGVNRQIRNLICAIPFLLMGYFMSGFPLATLLFTLSYIGVNMGFDNWPLGLKGFITFPPTGWLTLPLSYYIGDKTKWKNVTSEYLSGFFYGVTLYVWSLI